LGDLRLGNREKREVRKWRVEGKGKREKREVRKWRE
jgi:hypothetical protein